MVNKVIESLRHERNELAHCLTLIDSGDSSLALATKDRITEIDYEIAQLEEEEREEEARASRGDCTFEE